MIKGIKEVNGNLVTFERENQDFQEILTLPNFAKELNKQLNYDGTRN